MDFIIHSVNDVLKAQFGQTLGSRGVHILDPFTGTGTFITRLLQSGLIAPEELAHKYREEIHANEIVLLAYYIAAINIETVYHELSQGTLREDAPYEPFEGILLTDTFQMYEQERDMIANLLPDNSERRTRQKELDIRVIIGNPPYSGGQENANDDAANISYPQLDAAIRDTYADASAAKLKNQLYNSYIRAFRWASDRLGDAGIMSFVAGSAWIERGYADGMRKCLVEEFSDLYIFHLRGDIRKNMLSRGAAREGQNIFDSGSMTGISIAVLVKNSKKAKHGEIHFHDIGPDLTTVQKKNIIRNFGSIDGIAKADGWQRITPDERHDWLDQVDPSFEKYMQLGSKEKGEEGNRLFLNYSVGLMSGRDAWVVNASRAELSKNVNASIDFFNAELIRVSNLPSNEIEKALNYDPKKISWTRELKRRAARRKKLSAATGRYLETTYRPFSNSWTFLSRDYNEIVGQFPKILPSPKAANRFILVSGVGSRAGFSTLICDRVVSRDTIEKCQCFPLYLYEDTAPDDGMFASGEDGPTLTRRDAITDAGLAHFQAAYPGEEISKEDLFYYIYGLLHSPDYRERFKNNLAKALPRIPAVKSFSDFAAFRDAGRALGDLHVNFESVEPYMVTFKEGTHDLIPEAQADPVKFYRVKKMKFGGKGKEKDKTTVIYNENITMQNVPLEAYDYVVNGKPALDWVMDRQVVKTDKASGIVNDANDYANETVGDPRYPMELFQRVITVSLETMKIVNGLPGLEID